MHIDQEQTLRFLHGELDAASDGSVRQHLAGCEECRLRVEDEVREEQEIDTLLHQLDHPRPSLSAAEVMATPPPARRAWGRWAAGILLLGGAGTAWAYPGSPVPGWTDTAIEFVRSSITEISQTVREIVQDGPAVAAPQSAAQPGGLGVPPGASLVVAFETEQADRSVHVVLDDGDEVWASAYGGTASFTSDDDRLVIGNAGSTASYEIRIPRNAPRVEIRIAERSVFLKDGQTVTTAAPSTGNGEWVIDLAPVNDPALQVSREVEPARTR